MDIQSDLFRAVKSGTCTEAGRCLDNGADANMPAPEGETPLLMAVERGNPVMVLLLLSRGAEVDGRVLNGRTPLFYAVEEGNMEIVELLIGRGADVNACSRQGYTPLHRAVLEKRKAWSPVSSGTGPGLIPMPPTAPRRSRLQSGWEGWIL